MLFFLDKRLLNIMGIYSICVSLLLDSEFDGLDLSEEKGKGKRSCKLEKIDSVLDWLLALDLLDCSV